MDIVATKNSGRKCHNGIKEHKAIKGPHSQAYTTYNGSTLYQQGIMLRKSLVTGAQRHDVSGRRPAHPQKKFPLFLQQEATFGRNRSSSSATKMAVPPPLTKSLMHPMLRGMSSLLWPSQVEDSQGVFEMIRSWLLCSLREPKGWRRAREGIWSNSFGRSG